MSKIKELLKQERYDELWQLCCGYLDLSLDQFMAIQKQLLLEQLQLLKRSSLGRKVMRGALPETVEEFREQVPLTKYIDYCPELLEKREDCLPVKPIKWAHTSGKSGEFPCKWVPITSRTMDEMAILMYAANLLATCHTKGEFIKPPKKFLYATAPAPYTSGIFGYKCEEEFGWQYFPSPSESEKMSFLERLDKGFWMALDEGIDGIYGFTSILVAIGEKFKNGAKNIDIKKLVRHPKALLRLIRASIKSKIAGRPILPRDLWKIKGMACGGTDSFVFREKIKEMWGVQPLDIYAGTEGLIVAMQTWDYEGMTFVPNLNFLEFIPESEYFKWKEDNSYQPKTVLLNEVKAGEIYEIVITNFHGGIMTRYRPGDMIKITTLKNEKLGIDIPQMVFERRADDLIDLGLIRLTEKVIWKAIENTSIKYVDWTAKKDFVDGKPVLHLFIEVTDEQRQINERQLGIMIFEEMRKIDDGFIHSDLAGIQKIMNYEPIRVSFLPSGAFRKYSNMRQQQGADLAQLKPPRINPSNEILTLLGFEQQPIRQQIATQKEPTVAIR